MMVTRWGLSDELGTVAYGENQEEVFLGYSVARQQNISEETEQKIDAEIRRLVEDGYAEAQQILDREARRSRNARQGPARIRDADRRRDQGPARRQAADARIRDRAGDAALVGRADRRQGPPRPETGGRWSRSRRRKRAAEQSRTPAPGGRSAFWTVGLTFLKPARAKIGHEISHDRSSRDPARTCASPRLCRTGAVLLRLPSVLSGRCAVERDRYPALGAAIFRRDQLAAGDERARLAYPRDALRLRRGGDGWLSLDRNPELDRPAAGLRSALGGARAALGCWSPGDVHVRDHRGRIGGGHRCVLSGRACSGRAAGNRGRPQLAQSASVGRARRAGGGERRVARGIAARGGRPLRRADCALRRSSA